MNHFGSDINPDSVGRCFIKHKCEVGTDDKSQRLHAGNSQSGERVNIE